MEDASHGGLDGSVVAIDRFWVVRSAPRAEWLSCSDQGFDGFVAQDEERRHRPETGRQRLVAASVADSVDDVLAAEFSSDHKRRGGDHTVMGFAWCVRKPEPPRGRR